MSRGAKLISISTIAFGLLATPLTAPAFAQEAATATTGIKLSGDQPIQIDSDKVDVRDNDGTATFTGNVTVVQGATLLKAGSMIVYYIKPKKDAGGTTTDAPKPAGITGASSQDIDHIEVNDKVYVKSQDQVATGDHGTFDMKTEVLVLTGSKVVLSQGDNVAVGCKLTAQLKTGQAQLESCKSGQTGRVSIIVAPKNAPKN
ncbi:LptA/OstA family protein [Phyllobacterium endophyticum]|uniref:LPS ABC transporter substrate-binding protein LptA n=1 Tax=Phyllobacterium endophyticum TaxID=1149773 RepID=A0A2P7B009_9HYPH|nr:LptA/OstA family protein [Phyllobacterium endophyticum]MBB3235579.1 lipopolysaccharide export system protein LptA [Phyllobacterium endophyticum]PSH59790.1 LPS ABC transporter substrate-binding protein LptA [Phyllobacterium endophyticum]TYR41938.1 LPS ABC transporter substrate-binding protein LptA [Phyllobacterium endophyticum]